MRLIDADGAVEEIKRNKLLAREPATVRCIEAIKNATTYAESPKSGVIGEWIPVGEQLPEYDGLYLACLDDGYISSVEYNTDESGMQGWELWADSGEVIAWMPLPESYKQD